MNGSTGLLFVKIVLLFVIVWQDFKYRGVYWFVFPLLLTAEIATQLTGIVPLDIYLFNAALNCSLIFVQILVLYIYFRFIRNISGLFENAFGLGDLFMLVCFAFAFAFAGFILFCLITFVTAILVVLIGRMVKKDISLSVPLAGIQAGIYCVLLLINSLYSLPILSLNYWLFNFSG